MSLPDELTVPTAQFCNHLLTLILEGDGDWHCSDEVSETVSYRDLANTANVESVDVDENEVTIFSTLQRTVSEKVTRATHNPPRKAHPAEYRNHDVGVHFEGRLEWSGEEYALPVTSFIVEQTEYPTEPPAPDVDAYRYDL